MRIPSETSIRPTQARRRFAPALAASSGWTVHGVAGAAHVVLGSLGLYHVITGVTFTWDLQTPATSAFMGVRLAISIGTALAGLWISDRRRAGAWLAAACHVASLLLVSVDLLTIVFLAWSVWLLPRSLPRERT